MKVSLKAVFAADNVRNVRCFDSIRHTFVRLSSLGWKWEEARGGP